MYLYTLFVKKWYIKINKKTEGPFTLEELSKDVRIYPNMWVRKRYTLFWKKAKEFKELVPLFKNYYFFENKMLDDDANSICSLDSLAIQSSVKPLSPFWEWLILLGIMFLLYLIFWFSR